MVARCPLVCACAAHATLSLAVAALFARDAGEAPYMDEIFHVRQTQRYCAGELRSWDPKITTPPGLYLLGAPWALAVGRLQNATGPASEASYSSASAAEDSEHGCSLGALRFLNVVLALGCVVALAAVHRARGFTPAKAAAHALMLSL